MADKVKVRLSIRPDEDTEVDREEVDNLRSQGLLIEDDAKPTADEQAAEYEAARQRAAAERAAAEEPAKTGKAARGQNAGE